MTAPRACIASLALLLLTSFGPDAPVCSAQDFPAVREIRAHRANYLPRSKRTIRRIIIHTSEGSESSCVNWFLNPRARLSAHYLVSKRGRITRFVPDMSIAYHARNDNADTIGIENEGYANKNGWTTAQYEALAHLVRALCDKYKIPKDRRHILGHYELRGARGKTDPGRYFDWARFMALVRGSSTPAASSTGAAAVVEGVAAAIANERAVFEVTGNGVNVRSAPNGTVLGQVDRGARFVVDRQSGDWARISWRGREAWISARYLRSATGTFVVVRVSSLNVRAQPSTAGARLGQLGRDQAYYRVASRGAWVQIQFDHRTAWVHSGYVRTVTDPVP